MASKKARVIVSLVLRIFTLLFAAACIVVLILDKATDDDGLKVTFKDVITYKYVVATAVVAATYCLLAIALTLYIVSCLYREEAHSWSFLANLIFLWRQGVVAFVLATGVGAGFLTTAEVKRFLNGLLESFGARLKDTPFEGFFDRGYLATALLAAAFLCMSILSILSAPPDNKASGNKAAGKKGFFFG
ncbi:Detected protein of unknown function [Hibiscus syriacus]|uniref:CASP-like protein n=1 Tax=Hibiscus syriacus TaxID=106335 RepID=A0A6A2XDS0_HIBSY|nr:Detected protein of unknown function [Hibiscus syriacus]